MNEEHALIPKETEAAIQAIAVETATDGLLTMAQGLVTLIPTVGGPLSFVMSEYRHHRNMKRIVGAFSKLHDEVQDITTQTLTQDEVSETVQKVVDETLQTSSEEKVEYLANCLVNAFVDSSIEYPTKEYFLSTLVSLGPGEISILRGIYILGDPFIIRVRLRPPTEDLFRGLVDHRSSITYTPPPSYDTSYEEPDTGQTLKLYLQQVLGGGSTGVLQAIVTDLDGRGLTSIAPNLERRTIEKRTERPFQQEYSGIKIAQVMAFNAESSLRPRQTPIAASRTDFGREFIDYIQHVRRG